MNTSDRSRIVAAPRARLTAAERFLIARCPETPHYSLFDITSVILPTYWSYATSVGVDPVIALAQCLHETDYLRSFWSARPQRNPAGIGVNGRAQTNMPSPATGWAYNTDREQWEQGLSFATWTDDAIPAHIGRLLAYALPRNTGTPEQQAAIARALNYRTLPWSVRGSAPVLRQLGRVHNPSGQGWASPGTNYGARISELANRIIAMDV